MNAEAQQAVNDGLVSISDYARSQGVAKSGVKKMLDKLEGQKLIVSIRRDRQRYFDPARFEAAKLFTGDPSRRLDEPAPSPAPVFASVKAEHEAVKKELASLELDKARGELVSARALERAAVETGTKIAQAIDMLAGAADDLTGAALSGGRDAVKAMLRQRLRTLREEIGRLMSDMAEKALKA